MYTYNAPSPGGERSASKSLAPVAFGYEQQQNQNQQPQQQQQQQHEQQYAQTIERFLRERGVPSP